MGKLRKNYSRRTPETPDSDVKLIVDSKMDREQTGEMAVRAEKIRLVRGS